MRTEPGVAARVPATPSGLVDEAVAVGRVPALVDQAVERVGVLGGERVGSFSLAVRQKIASGHSPRAGVQLSEFWLDLAAHGPGETPSNLAACIVDAVEPSRARSLRR